MTITKFDKKNLPIVREAINKALAEVSKQFGLKALYLGNIRYEMDGLSFKSEVKAEIDASVSPEGQAAVDAKNLQNSKLLGFNMNIVGETFFSQGRKFTVTTLKIDRPKYPVVAVDEKNKAFKFGAEHLNWTNKEIKNQYTY